MKPFAAGSRAEVSLTGLVGKHIIAAQVDRLAVTPTEVWIIDYKTAHADNLDPAAALPVLRKIFAPQLEAYATILRNLRGAGLPIRAGLYYPRMQLLDWWEI